MIKNYLDARPQHQESSHGGSGPVALYEIWQAAEFHSSVDFFDRVVIPPGSCIGYHRHGSNEEMYILLQGEGLMTIDGKEVRVAQGDMILNPAGGMHGLVNNSQQDIDLLVIQVGISPGGPRP